MYQIICQNNNNFIYKQYNMSTNPQMNSTTPECGSSSKMQNDINHKIYDRNVPSQMLQPYLNVRPVSTKYSIMPIVDPRVKPTVPMQQQPTYNTNNVFNPGNTQSPWSGYSSSVNTESELRNQIYALQKCSQATFVPQSSSDLYAYSFKPNESNTHQQQFPGLFKTERFERFNPNPEQIGGSLFNNSTRVQIKNMTKDTTVCSIDKSK